MIIIVISCTNCTKSVYVEDLTLRLEPVRALDVRFGTPTFIYKNDYVYEEAFYVHYNKNRVTWFTDRSKTESVSVPVKEVYKIGYRSRTLGTIAGFTSGYLVGVLMYNLGLISHSDRPFLSQSNQKVTFAYAGIFAIGGFTAGIPINTIFKKRKAQVKVGKKWDID